MVLAGTTWFDARQKQALVSTKKMGGGQGKVCCFKRDMESNWEICAYTGANETFITTSIPGRNTGRLQKATGDNKLADRTSRWA